MRILVTGSAGFIGSNLCARLLGDGHEVVGLDDMSTGRPSNLERLKHHSGAGVYMHIPHDVRLEIPATGAFDLVYHLACPASPPKYMQEPMFTLKTAFMGTDNAVEFADRKGCRLVAASTSEIYGDPIQHPQRETYWGNVNPIGPRSMYDEGKRAAEALMAVAIRDGQDILVARIFNTYGPGMDIYDGRVVTNFLRAAVNGDPLLIYGDGNQTRSLCYVDDTVDCLVRMGMYDKAEAAYDNDPLSRIYNVGSENEVSVLQLAQIIVNGTASPSEIRHVEAWEDDPRMRRPITARAQLLLDWHPKIPLNEGLAATEAWVRDELRRYSK